MISHSWAENADRFFTDVIDWMRDNMLREDTPHVAYICTISNYQGNSGLVSRQLGDEPEHAPFTLAINSAKESGGPMLVGPNNEAAGTNCAGLYSRLWTVWEMYKAWQLKIPVVASSRDGLNHLFGGGEDGHLCSIRYATASNQADVDGIKAHFNKTENSPFYGVSTRLTDVWSQLDLLAISVSMGRAVEWKDDLNVEQWVVSVIANLHSWDRLSRDRVLRLLSDPVDCSQGFAAVLAEDGCH